MAGVTRQLNGIATGDEAAITRVRASDAHRGIPLSRASHITGSVPIAGVSIPFESALERDFIHVTSIEQDVASIMSQPITLAFVERGVERHYTPDFLVRYQLQTPPRLIEVKYQAELRKQAEFLKGPFAAGRIWCSLRGWEFAVLTENQIRGPRLANAKRLFRFRDHPVDPPTRTMILALLDQPKPIAELQLGPDLLPTLWALIAQGQIVIPLDLPITPSSVARRA